MEISRENFRAMIFYDYKYNLTLKQCIDRLHLAFGDEAPSNRTVYNLFAKFQSGRTFLVMNSVKVVHPRLLLPLMLMLCVKWLSETSIPRDSGILRHWYESNTYDFAWSLERTKTLQSLDPTQFDRSSKYRLVLNRVKKFNRGWSNLVYNIVTGDEIWIYSYEPESKQ